MVLTSVMLLMLNQIYKKPCRRYGCVVSRGLRYFEKIGRKMNLNNIPFRSAEATNVLVEIPQGSNLKYELDEASGEMKVDFVFDNLFFPFNYGLIPHTLGGDGFCFGRRKFYHPRL